MEDNKIVNKIQYPVHSPLWPWCRTGHALNGNILLKMNILSLFHTIPRPQPQLSHKNYDIWYKNCSLCRFLWLRPFQATKQTIRTASSSLVPKLWYHSPCGIDWRYMNPGGHCDFSESISRETLRDISNPPNSCPLFLLILRRWQYIWWLPYHPTGTLLPLQHRNIIEQCPPPSQQHLQSTQHAHNEFIIWGIRRGRRQIGNRGHGRTWQEPNHHPRFVSK